jgi:hypothetical protein
MGINIAGFATGAAQTSNQNLVIMGFVAAVNTSARTYKMRFLSVNANTTTSMGNGSCTGRIYALEISA